LTRFSIATVLLFLDSSFCSKASFCGDFNHLIFADNFLHFVLKMVKTVGKYELYRTLGEGSFGKVKYAVNKETNEAVAVKILDKDKIQKQNMGAQIKKEISIMRMIKHNNVVCVKDVFATTSKIFIVLELVEGGELFDKITSQGRLSEPQARFYFRQVVEGLDHCHSQGVCHRDLKPEVFTALYDYSDDC
jgi:serine/threonine protein kinase